VPRSTTLVGHGPGHGPVASWLEARCKCKPASCHSSSVEEYQRHQHIRILITNKYHTLAQQHQYQHRKSLIHQYRYDYCRKSHTSFHFPALHCRFQYSVHARLQKSHHLLTSTAWCCCSNVFCVLNALFCKQFGFSQYSVSSDVHFVLTRSTVLLYDADMWSMTVTARPSLDAFHKCCLRHILRIPYTAHVSNLTVRKRTQQSRVTSIILDRRLKLFDHIRRADPSHDHARTLQASINRLSEDWRRPSDRPRQSWLRTIEGDLRTQNIGLSSAWHIAQRRGNRVMETAILQEERVTR